MNTVNTEQVSVNTVQVFVDAVHTMQVRVGAVNSAHAVLKSGLLEMHLVEFLCGCCVRVELWYPCLPFKTDTLCCSHSMETSTHLQSLEAMVSCSVCYAVLTQAACTLSCHHNLCATHRAELVLEVDKHNIEGVRCPVCNTFSKRDDIGGNKLMNDLVDAFCKVNLVMWHQVRRYFCCA